MGYWFFWFFSNFTLFENFNWHCSKLHCGLHELELFLLFLIIRLNRNSHRNFAKITGKHLCQSLFFNKVAGLRPATLLEKRLWHWCFHVNFAKSLRTPFFTENLWETASYAIIILLKRTTTCYSWGCLLVIHCKYRRTGINFWISIWTAPRKSMNKDIWEVGTSRQIFKRGSYTETKLSRKKCSYLQNSVLYGRSI